MGTKSRLKLARAWGRGDEELLLKGHTVSFRGNEVLEIDNGDGCTTS